MIIYALVAVHNRWAFTDKFLVSLQDQDLPNGVAIHTVVVDDGSTDKTASFLADRPDTTVITGTGSWWWAGSVSRGLFWINSRITDQDYVYLGNNDTVLDSHHIRELLTSAQADSCDLVGSISYEIWPTGERHPVSSAFCIDPQELNVVNIPAEQLSQSDIHALAGRGLLLSAAAARAIRFHPAVMPQHFADLAATGTLIEAGFRACVAVEAVSTQLERAGSSVEFKPSLAQLMSRRSPLYVPALVTFWWMRSSQRIPLAWRMPRRAIREVTRGSYRVR